MSGRLFQSAVGVALCLGAACIPARHPVIGQACDEGHPCPDALRCAEGVCVQEGTGGGSSTGGGAGGGGDRAPCAKTLLSSGDFENDFSKWSLDWGVTNGMLSPRFGAGRDGGTAAQLSATTPEPVELHSYYGAFETDENVEYCVEAYVRSAATEGAVGLQLLVAGGTTSPMIPQSLVVPDGGWQRLSNHHSHRLAVPMSVQITVPLTATQELLVDDVCIEKCR
ncbi:MAG: hypothetical protein K1X64_07295 [Myxococcaceae bacterium]|nr:hypothetical protein [Myxococcaceae bacterium]